MGCWDSRGLLDLFLSLYNEIEPARKARPVMEIGLILLEDVRNFNDLDIAGKIYLCRAFYYVTGAFIFRFLGALCDGL